MKLNCFFIGRSPDWEISPQRKLFVEQILQAFDSIDVPSVKVKSIRYNKEVTHEVAVHFADATYTASPIPHVLSYFVATPVATFIGREVQHS
jgi:hypothetical protein